MSDIMTLGLCWNSNMEIESSILMLDEEGNLVDRVNFAKTTSDDEAIVHGGASLNTADGPPSPQGPMVDTVSVMV
jgi:stress response protein SCP2